MTQQNAGMVEEAAAASEIMDSESRGLEKLVAFFTIDGIPAGAQAHNLSQGGYESQIRH